MLHPGSYSNHITMMNVRGSVSLQNVQLLHWKKKRREEAQDDRFAALLDCAIKRGEEDNVRKEKKEEWNMIGEDDDTTGDA